jgi:CheY-like chemotaxis protein
MNDYILVVDDDEAIREFVSMALSDEGYVIQTAQDGASALVLADQAQPSLILLDMRMPVMDGWAFVSSYRAVAAPANQTSNGTAPIVIMSAATDASAYAKQVKADAYLAKPFDIDQLLRTVQNFVSPGTTAA